jgi:hypothetical protein
MGDGYVRARARVCTPYALGVGGKRGDKRRTTFRFMDTQEIVLDTVRWTREERKPRSRNVVSEEGIAQ